MVLAFAAIASIMISVFAGWRLGWFAPSMISSYMMTVSLANLFLVSSIYSYFYTVEHFYPIPLTNIYDRPDVAATLCLLMQLAAITGGGIGKIAFHGGRQMTPTVTGIRGALFDSSSEKMYIFIAAIAAIVFALLHFSLLNKSILLVNSHYLDISTPDINGLGGGVGRIIQFLILPVCALCAGLTPLAIARRLPTHTGLLLIPALYGLVLAASDNSRWTPLIVGTFMASWMIIMPRRRAALAVLIPLILLSYMVVIVGRTQPEQGLLAIPNNIVRIFYTNAWETAQNLFSYTFDLALNVAAAMDLGGIYSNTYKILSFSPLPSLIDNFDAIQSASDERFNVYAPVGAVGAAYLFGWAYFALLTAIYAMFNLAMDVGYYKLREIPRAVWVFFTIFIYTQLADYPVRSSARFMITATVAVAALSFYRNRGRNRDRRSMRRDFAPDVLRLDREA